MARRANEPAAVAPSATAPAPAPALPTRGLVMCQVWAFGSLKHDGVEYAPGALGEFPPELVDELPRGLLTPVE